MSSISAGLSDGTALVSTGDTTGELVLKTNGGTTAVTIGTDQSVTFAAGVVTTSPTVLPAGTASAPALTTTGDTNTGIFFPAADTTAIATGGTERMRVDSSGNVGVNNTSPAVLSSTTQVAVKANTSADAMFVAQNSNGLTTAKFGFQFTGSVDNPVIGSYTNHPFLFLTNNTERMRINSSGALLINRTTQVNSERFAITGLTGSQCMALVSPVTTAYDMCNMINGNGQVGVIGTNGTATTYGTSSDYRLKENIAPMTGALDKVALLKPCTYTWKVNGSVGQGFIAHELQAVVPDCVTGEKDAVNEDGSIKPQGVDTSFLVATLTAAIQELSAKNDALEARIAALEGNEPLPPDQPE